MPYKTLSYVVSLLIPCCLFLSACLVVPTSVSNPLSHERIDAIQLQTSSRKDVLNTLGEPEVRRDNNNIWIYSAGHMAGILLLFSGQGSGANLYSYEWLFLRFNDKDRLVEKQLLNEKHACTSSDYCLRSGWYKKDNKYRLSNELTILLQPENKAVMQPVKNTYCRLFLYYLGQDDIFLHYLTTSVMINGLGPFITDEKTYASIDLPAGKLSITLPAYSKNQLIKYNPGYDCPAGETRYLGLSLTVDKEIFKKHFRPHELDIFMLEPAVATEAIRQRRQVVNP